MAKLVSGVNNSIALKVSLFCKEVKAEHTELENGSITIFQVGMTKKDSDLLTEKIREAFKGVKGVSVSFDETYDLDLCDEDEDNGYVLEAVVALS